MSEEESSRREALKERVRQNKSSGRSMMLVLGGITVAVIGAVGVLVGAAVFMIGAEEEAEVADGSFLRVDLAGPITDAPSPGDIFTEPDDLPLTATELAHVIRSAGDDDRISGLYLNMQVPMLGWGLAREVREAIVDFKESDKPCVAYGEIWTMKDFYLASPCDELLIAPSGVPQVLGQSLSVTYYHDALDYLGVEPRIVHVGDYKTAIEPYERMEPSEAAKESYEFLLDGLWGTVVQEIADARGVSVETVQAMIDEPTLVPRKAVENRMLTGMAYEDALLANLRDVGSENWRDGLMGLSDVNDLDESLFTEASEYWKDVKPSDAGDRIAVIFAEGTILPGQGSNDPFGGNEGLFDGRFRRWTRAALEDDSVKAVVIRVNSPGGSALAADMMNREVELLREAGKPVVISMADYAASGGYMMSANADWIISQPTTITGSIGVFGLFFDVSGTMESLKLASHTYKRGERADIMDMTSEHDEGDRRILQEFVDDTYADFVQMVADGRGQSVDAVEGVAQGRVWTGSQAIGARGLVDQLGGLEEALVKARDLAGVDAPGLRVIPKKKSFVESFVEELVGEEGEVATPPVVRMEMPIEGLEEALEEVRVMREIQSAGGVAAYLPGMPSLK